jgi:predicted O-methyltransferase YrrM
MNAARSTLRRAKRGLRSFILRPIHTEAGSRRIRPAVPLVAAMRLRRRVKSTVGIDPLLDLAYEFDVLGLKIDPWQVRSEIRGLLTTLEEDPPRRILEIGTANGGTLFLFAQVAAKTAHVISVDLPHGEFGGGYPPRNIPLYKAFRQKGQRFNLVRGDSHSPQTFERVARLLGGEQLDLLFIDGDHTYEGVKSDFETYSPLVRPGGLIGFHDIAPPTSPERLAADSIAQVGDVPRYWNQLKETHADSREFVDPTAGGCFGIGVIRV